MLRPVSFGRACLTSEQHGMAIKGVHGVCQCTDGVLVCMACAWRVHGVCTDGGCIDGVCMAVRGLHGVPKRTIQGIVLVNERGGHAQNRVCSVCDQEW